MTATKTCIGITVICSYHHRLEKRQCLDVVILPDEEQLKGVLYIKGQLLKLTPPLEPSKVRVEYPRKYLIRPGCSLNDRTPDEMDVLLMPAVGPANPFKCCSGCRKHLCKAYCLESDAHVAICKRASEERKEKKEEKDEKLKDVNSAKTDSATTPIKSVDSKKPISVCEECGKTGAKECTSCNKRLCKNHFLNHYESCKYPEAIVHVNLIKDKTERVPPSSSSSSSSTTTTTPTPTPTLVSNTDNKKKRKIGNDIEVSRYPMNVSKPPVLFCVNWKLGMDLTDDILEKLGNTVYDMTSL